MWRALAWSLTFLFVVVTWVFFRADSLDTSVRMLQSMAGFSSVETATEIEGLGGTSGFIGVGFGWAAIVFALVWVLVAPSTQELMRRFMRASMYRPYIERAAGLLQPSWRVTPGWVVGSAAVFAAAFLGLSRVSEFIYYNF